MTSTNEQHSTVTQYQKAQQFKALHASGAPFVMPNAWDRGTARVLEQAWFRAIATTSAGLAFSLGKPDRAQCVTREETLENARALVSATRLPVSVDLEDGFGDGPEAIMQTFCAAAATGAVGGSIEDYSGDPARPIRDFATSVARVEAAAAAVKRLPFAFTLTARAENFLYGAHDLPDTIARLRAYRAVGADVLYAPGLPDAESIKAVCLAVDAPVNALLGAGNRLSVATLFSLGVTRVSLGSALSRAALGSMVTALEELQQHGTCDFLDRAVGYVDVAARLSGRARR